ncbi:hypothetical protein TVAG_473360 [Trichomonas vaginalis G3]|uniref:Gamma-secretase subunit PEN-2 n=1 Tax=Trichomonas vaginalis (strain ATCC PRA-98 / G3) TaxID=412133 RepID=A2EUF3_TRIV3|nr:hypothetical protein TVAGG3_0317220 [Trichomonas vaginalis G3]EAY03712.1 hypothetical protein TVAG_473360 [Trichomonas vaginalis G3]KAI5529024.1 hypothetical protein TVAGG3_0317220 [Trichomonas vaginalis G3]|eukprot:XP_001315935.1 hypothetical protein [Trichomonas vaginalis G3]
MDPGKKDPLDVYIKNANIMFKVGFALCPLCWLMCWIYCLNRQTESQELVVIGKRSFWLFWLSLYILGIWTLCYSAWWTKMEVIGYNVPYGEPQ